MDKILMGVQMVLSVILIVVVMNQDTKEAVKTEFTGDTQSYFKPKGKEAFLGNITRVVGVLFFINALVMLVAQ